jgi:hypothetical protein
MNQKPKRCLQVAYDQCINEPVPFAALDDAAQALNTDTDQMYPNTGGKTITTIAAHTA